MPSPRSAPACSLSARPSATFALIVVGEIAYGIGIGWFSLRLRRWARDPRVEITLSLLTPYAAFLVPQHLGGSGVLATVAAGLYVSWNGPLLIPATTRLQGIFFWDLLVYLLEGLVFLVTGMQMRTLIDHADAVFLRDLAIAVPLIIAVLIVSRVCLDFPGGLRAAMAQPGAGAARPGAALAVVVRSVVRRRARRRLARRGARHPADHGRRHAVSAPRFYSVRHVRRHRRHADRARGWCCRRSCAGWRCRTTPRTSAGASRMPRSPRASKHSRWGRTGLRGWR